MINKLIRSLLYFVAVLLCSNFTAQSQKCPVNINFADGTLNHWFAYTGTFIQNSSRVASIKQTYDTLSALPSGTLGAVSIPENGFPSMPGIQVFTTSTTDKFGGFSTLPNINGYIYNYAIQIGSTSVNSSPGGYFRGVGYVIDVPLGSGPYTMTYAYAMVLENGSHASIEQPLASATLMTNDSIIYCASPQYFLPTIAGSLDVATATKNGFKQSNTPTPNNVRPTENALRVWYKDWTEVTFDLEAYRGQKVTLTFAAENCVPKGHFAYAYIALRNDCNGLVISGNKVACTNSPQTYSIPALTGATYQWSVPPGWKITSDSNSNIITVTPGSQPGFITAREQNSCADLEATIQVSTSLPTVPGAVSGNNIVCEGINASPMQLSGNNGNVVKWISSNDGINWVDIANTTNNYTANNLDYTTQFKALVQNGPACSIDSATSATVVVNSRSVGGSLSPSNLQICQDQNKDAILNLTAYNGNIVNWQSSQNSVLWTDFNPKKTNATYSIAGLLAPSSFRVIVKNGVCKADTSSVAAVGIFNEKFPKAFVSPLDTAICFGDGVNLTANITIGTSYTWNNPAILFNPGNGTITALPYAINAKAAPSKTTTYILSIKNGNCPNLLIDTFNVDVISPITVNAGHDTSVVANQPLQLQAITNYTMDNANLKFTWRPITGLNNPFVSNPIATLNTSIDSILYIVKVATAEGCYAEDAVVVRVFKTQPDIFVPSGFTPNNDGRNDILKPIPVGITKLDFFSVYNRFGQLIYTTSEFGKGWDGNFSGSAQPSGTYVFIAQGVDFTGKVIFKKGTSVLVR